MRFSGSARRKNRLCFFNAARGEEHRLRALGALWFICVPSASRGHGVERAADPLHRAGINAKTLGNPADTFTNRTNCTHNIRQLAACFFFIIERTSRSNVKVASRLRHPRSLCVASSAGAQGNLDQGKTAAQLYASNCATCHESLASIRNTKSFFELKSFLSQHYTSNSESAANLAAYLKGQERPSVESQRRRGAMNEVRPPEPAPSASEEDIIRPPADIPEVPPSAIAPSLSPPVDTAVKPHRRASSARPLPRLRPAEIAPAPAAANKPASVQIND
jgi:hypothetical protein